MNKVKHNCDNINCNHNDTKGLCCLFNPENCKYRQLQRENAELKEKLKDLEHGMEIVQEIRELAHSRNGRMKKQLTKAKEIIENLLSDNRTMKAQFESEEQANVWFEHIHKAEQFLKDLEK